jgi:hypothetical protein
MWVDNIKMDLRDIGWGDMDWNHLAQDRDQWKAFVDTVGKYLSSCTTGSFSKRAQLMKLVS